MITANDNQGVGGVIECEVFNGGNVRARPVTGMTLSLVMIVKDEQEMLPGCLEAVKDAVDEMIVVDTGSSDRTVEIARSFGATVIDFPWNGSFADARNVSIDNASCDWVMYLDADEHMIPQDAPKLRALLARTWREAFYLVETNYTGGDESGDAVTHHALRLWRRRPQYRFEGRIHEQKSHTMPTYLPERFETSTVRMRHYGYLRSRITAKDKSRRNIELLEVESRENPSPFNQYNLEMSLASASMRVCWAIIPAAAEYRPFSIACAFLPWWGKGMRETASASSAGLCMLQSSLSPLLSFGPGNRPSPSPL